MRRLVISLAVGVCMSGVWYVANRAFRGPEITPTWATIVFSCSFGVLFGCWLDDRGDA